MQMTQTATTQKQYPAYKDSGVEWIGKIPEHWDKKALKFFSRIVLGKMLAPQDKGGCFLKPYLKAKNILWEKVGDAEISEMWFSENELLQYRLQENDLLVSEGGEVGRTAIWQNEIPECYIQNSVHKVSVNSDGNPRFFLYAFGLYGRIGHFDSIVNRVSIAHLTREKLKDVFFFAPASDEQQAIANFLDRKTALIDELIEKKKRQVELLKEQRQAIINQAVTKGLNPNVKMKDSGIEWLGDIPEHWEVKLLKYIGTNGLTNGIFKKKDQYGRGTKLVNVIDLYQGNLLVREEELGRVETDEDEALKYKVIKGDIFFVRSSLKLEGIGVSALVADISEPTVFECHIVRFRPLQNVVNPKFLVNYLNSWYVHQRLITLSQTVTMSTISQDKISSLEIALPALEEQCEVVEYIDMVSSKVEASISRAENQIQLLQEYRTALISEAVTGKIDVRE